MWGKILDGINLISSLESNVGMYVFSANVVYECPLSSPLRSLGLHAVKTNVVLPNQPGMS